MREFKNSCYVEFFANLLAALLIFNWPLIEVSRTYRIDTDRLHVLYRHCVEFLSPSSVWAAPPIADAGDDVSARKNNPVAVMLTLDGSGSHDPDGDPLTYTWYGPFGQVSGSSPGVTVPEGTYTISLIVNDGTASSAIDTSTVTVEPCFTLSDRAKSGKVQLEWPPQPDTVSYNVYRMDVSGNSDFVLTGSTDSTYSTYLDQSVTDGNTYLYVVEALSECAPPDPEYVTAALEQFTAEFGRSGCSVDTPCDMDSDRDGDVDGKDLADLMEELSRSGCASCFSSIAAAHPASLGSVSEPGNPPVIYSSAIMHATTQIVYNYHVKAADPDPDDTLTFFLTEAPEGVAIDRTTGLIQWIPDQAQAGTHRIEVEVLDSKGLSASQSFILSVTAENINHPPLALDDAYEVRTGRILSVPVPGVMENDSDPDEDSLNATKVTDPRAGSLDFRPDGSFEYTPSLLPLSTLDFSLKYKYTYAEAGASIMRAVGNPVAIDDDRDGIPDVVFVGRYDNVPQLTALRGDSGELLFQKKSGGPDFSSTAHMAAGDIDSDGMPEFVIIGGETGGTSMYGLQLIAYEHTGDIKWVSEPLPNRYRHSFDPHHVTDDGNFRDGAVAIADIDMDGTPEIVVGHGRMGRVGVTVYDNSGKKRWTSIGTRTWGTSSSNPSGEVMISDINLDGKPEIVYLNTAYSCKGETLWVVDIRPSSYAGGAIANLDDDPYAEIVMWEAFGLLVVLEHTGEVKWKFQYDYNGQPGHPVVADVNRDGYPEIVASFGRTLNVLNRDGSLLWSASIEGASRGAPTVFDFDQDGYSEVALMDYDGIFKVWDGRNGELKKEFDTGNRYSSQDLIPIIADLDSDGHAELLCKGPDEATYGGIYVYESPNDDWTPVRSIWNQMTYHVTNINLDGSIPPYDEPNWLKPGLNTFRINENLPVERSNRYDKFAYKVNDGEYDSNVADVNITILPPNSVPKILSANGGTATETFAYRYQVLASDSDPGEILTFSLTSAPAGMTIDPHTGLISWTPASGQAGTHHVEVMVVDTQDEADSKEILIEAVAPITVPGVTGLTQEEAETAITGADLKVGEVVPSPHATIPAGTVISQAPAAGTIAEFGQAVAFTVSSGPDTSAPRVSVVATPSRFIAGGSTLLTVYVQDDGELASRSLSVDGTDLPLNASGQAVFTTNTPGVYTAVGEATDQAGNSARDEIQIIVGVAGDTTPPELIFSDPVDGDMIRGIRNVIGTVRDDNLLSYDLALSQDEGITWTTLGSDTSPVENGVLGTIDPSSLIDNPYKLRLRASDLNGNTAEEIIGIGITSENLKIGMFTISFNDLSVPVSGIPISIIRTYDSRDKSKHDFGVGWKLDIKTTDVVEDDDMNVFITLPDGRRTAFAFTPEYLGNWGSIPVYRPKYTAVSGSVTYTLTCPNCNIEITDYWGPWIDPITMEDFNPDTYILTALNGTVYTIDQYEGLEEMKDSNNNTLTFTRDGIIHSSGKSIDFVRDGLGRISEIIDPQGNSIEYTYDENGDLVGVTDREGNTSTFTYDGNHYLIDMITPEGVRATRNEYDEKGRLTATIDADGNRVSITHNTDTRQEVVSDRLGNITVYEYDAHGNVTCKTDALGNVWSYSYDDHNNKTSETDPLGNTTTYTYDALNNLLTETDALGNTTSYTYDDMGHVLTVTDPLGNVTSYTYDANGNPQNMTDPLGHTTTYTYDANGNRLTTTDPLGNVTALAYDTYGNLVRMTDSLGHVTTYTYDLLGNRLTETVTRTTLSGPETITTTKTYNSQGQLVATTDPLGNTTTTEYDANGKKSSVTDRNGNRTSYVYDAMGNLVETTYPDGTTEKFTFDANGNNISATDRAGRTTFFIYDALNRVVSRKFPGGSTTTTAYDAAGRVVAVTDTLGHTTTTGYDALGRRVSVTDALGNVSTWVYDANGNMTTFTDANGHTTSYEYDANKRLLKTTFADGTFTTSTYDTLGRKVRGTDQAGVTTQFTYDQKGRLLSVIDALGQVTSYTYDELGNRISQTDANGHTTTFEFDALGRMTKRTLPLGMFETMAYDANGKLVSKTDFNGETITLTHDENNRLTSKTFPDGSSVSFTYTATGQRATVTDARGTTSYTYDDHDRLLAVVYPDGATISYAYDAMGNRLSVTVPSGITNYTYDALNRLATVTGPDGGLTTYTYDAVGNRASGTYPNGVTTTYVYDNLNRLVHLESRRSDSTLISSYTYTLGAAGNRTRVAENTGRTVDYTYDVLYRLVREEISDPYLGNETISYTYDPVGNRLTRTDNSGTINYAYDANDRLLSEGGRSYAYDNNGNTLSKTEGAYTTTYGYDYENRLISALTPASTVDYTYDADGIRLSTTVDGTTTGYLVDKNRAYAQVLEEYEAGSRIAGYVYGDDLISQDRAGLTSYYLYDGQLSTRYLVDPTQSVTDSYFFDAFGRELGRTGSTANNYLYTGEQYDPTLGFYYLRARYYDENTGRFATMDVYPGMRFEPRTLHRYLYAFNNPVNYSDPSGNSPLTTTIIALSILTIVMEVIANAIPEALRLATTNKLLNLLGIYYSNELQTAPTKVQLEASSIVDYFHEWYRNNYDWLQHPYTGGWFWGKFSCGFQAQFIIEDIVDDGWKSADVSSPEGFVRPKKFKYKLHYDQLKYFKLRIYESNVKYNPNDITSRRADGMVHTYAVAQSDELGIYINLDSWMFGDLAPRMPAPYPQSIDVSTSKDYEGYYERKPKDKP